MEKKYGYGRAKPITSEDLDQFIFDFDKGIVYKRCSYHRKNANTGHPNNHGYLQIMGENNRMFLVHRLMYQAYYGDLDVRLFVDHINHDRQDNRPENLRQVTWTENIKNVKHQKDLSTRSKTGIPYLREVKSVRSRVTKKRGLVKYNYNRYLVSFILPDTGMHISKSFHLDEYDKAVEYAIRRSLEIHGKKSPFLSSRHEHLLDAYGIETEFRV